MWLGEYPEDFTTVVVALTTHAASGAPVAPSSALEAADFRIYKNGSASEKATTNGLTITSPFDSVTGLHFLVIDTSNDTGDAGFWVAGAVYTVVLVPDETVDGVAVAKVIGQFGIRLATDAIMTRLGAPAGASVSADIAAIEAQTDDIGAAGAGLTAVPWNASWDVQVESEVADALTAYGVPTATDAEDGLDEVLAAVAGVQAAVDGVPTNAELATALAAADDAVLAQVALVKAKTDNLPSDPADASVIAARFDTLDTSVADIPTNAELATALAGADDAVLAVLSTADGKLDAIGAKTTNLPSDPADHSLIAAATDAILAAVADVPTNAELATALAGADDAVLAQVALVKAKTDALPSDPADASVIAARFDTLDTSVAELPTNAELAAALNTYDAPTKAELDAAVAPLATAAAITAHDAKFTFSVPGKVDANLTHVNEVEIGGNGQVGTEFGPA